MKKFMSNNPNLGLDKNQRTNGKRNEIKWRYLNVEALYSTI